MIKPGVEQPKTTGDFHFLECHLVEMFTGIHIYMYMYMYIGMNIVYVVTLE